MDFYTYNRVLVIESLDPEVDYLSGTDLANFIRGLQEDAGNVCQVEHISVIGRTDLLAALSAEVVKAKAGDYPILHIETHGLENHSGLALANGSTISWLELTKALAPLNQATDFNLLICAAACFGGRGARMIQANNPSPCYALIGPDERVHWAELLSRFSTFYRVLFETQQTSAAFKALTDAPLNEGRFHAIGAHDWFFGQVRDYLNRYCTNEYVDVRIRRIVEESKTGADPKTYDQISAGANRRNLVFVDDVFRTFFMTDTIPSNVDRYASILDQARAFAHEFFDEQARIAAACDTP